MSGIKETARKCQLLYSLRSLLLWEGDAVLRDGACCHALLSWAGTGAA